MLVEVIGTPAMLEQTAKECVELAMYCRDENKVYDKSLDDMQFELSDGIADVEICMMELIANSEFKTWLRSAVNKRCDVKIDRMKERLEEDGKN